MNKIIFYCTLFIFCICTAIFPLYPRVVVGVGGHNLLYPNADQSLDTLWALSAQGLFSLRTLLYENSYLSLLAEVETGIVPNSEILIFDDELLFAEAGFYLGQGKLIVTAEYNSSLERTLTDLDFYSGEWKIQYFFLTELRILNPFIAYNGYMLFEPDSRMDVFVHEGVIGFEFNPSIQIGYALSFSFAWENWFEYPLYTSAGMESSETRNDYLGLCTVKTYGIFDFFVDWELQIRFGLRWSNANQYIETETYLDENSEDRFIAELEPKLGWSPDKQLNIQLKPRLAYESYFYREATDDAGILINENTFLLSFGGIFHLDWTPDNSVYFVVEVEGSRDFSNDSRLTSWECLLNFSLQYSFNF
jgi:hypothetical protein